MIEVRNALKVILDSVDAIASEKVELIEAEGRVLSGSIRSNNNVPAFDNSAMDGYAVRAPDIIRASSDRPKILEVIGDIKAGVVSKQILKKGQAIRIMTGALIPKGADSVVMVEETKRLGDSGLSAKKEVCIKNVREKSKSAKKEFVAIYKAIDRGKNIRKAGEDIKRGELIIPQGTLLNAAHLGILASLGIPRIEVARRPRVAILATGDELIDVNRAGGNVAPGKLINSNSYVLYAQVSKCGGIPKYLGISRDRPAELKKKIKSGLDCDLLLTSGGVSVGDYDLVKSVLAELGTDIRFWQVAMRPGKPLVFGEIKGIPVFGLPGNPVSGMVSFEVFVKPAILKMLGQRMGSGEYKEAVLEEDVAKKKGLKYFLRAHTRWEKGGYFTRTTGPQGSGILKSMALANSLIILPEDEEYIKKGNKVKVKFLT